VPNAARRGVSVRGFLLLHADFSRVPCNKSMDAVDAPMGFAHKQRGPQQNSGFRTKTN
jgi:hypothetical protein